MMYFILVGLQTVLLPLISGTINLVVAPGDPIFIFGMWWVFWGVGTRLLVAGIVQLTRPGFTSGIMGNAAPTESERTITRELAKANVGMGLAGLLALVPGWALPAGVAGGAFLLWAWIGHVGNKGKNPQELFATWTDFVVGVVVVVLAIYTLVRFLAG